MKFVFTAILALCISLCFGQNENVSFYKNDGRSVLLGDSADYMRVISDPDSGQAFFNVKEVFKNGKIKYVGKSSAFNFLRPEGVCVEYFENGKRRFVSNYKNGLLTGDNYAYFPNGKLYVQKFYSLEEKVPGDISNSRIIAAYDSLGKATVETGTGILCVYTSNFEKLEESGPIKNGQRDGDWHGESEGISYLETYNNGTLVKGYANKTGQTATYEKSRTERPQFPGGDKAFSNFVAKNLSYPIEDKKRGIQGKVILTFNVEVDGRVSDIQVVRGVSIGLDKAAIKAIIDSPKWIPGKKFGFTFRQGCSIPINFELNDYLY